MTKKSESHNPGPSCIAGREFEPEEFKAQILRPMNPSEGATKIYISLPQKEPWCKCVPGEPVGGSSGSQSSLPGLGFKDDEYGQKLKSACKHVKHKDYFRQV